MFLFSAAAGLFVACSDELADDNTAIQAACRTDRVHHVKAVELLSQQYFFTSPKLAALSAEAEVLAQASALRTCHEATVLNMTEHARGIESKHLTEMTNLDNLCRDRKHLHIWTTRLQVSLSSPPLLGMHWPSNALHLCTVHVETIQISK